MEPERYHGNKYDQEDIILTFPMKRFYILIFVIAVMLGVIYSISQTKVEAARVTVEITKSTPFNNTRLNESERDELIGDISLNKMYINKLAQPKGNYMSMPGISVGLFRNKVMVSEWTSVPVKDKGTYELTLGLNQPLKKGDIVRIAVYVNDEKGKTVIGKRIDTVWD